MVDVSRAQSKSTDFTSTLQVHRTALSQRLELERSGELQGSSLSMEPSEGHAAVSMQERREVHNTSGTLEMDLTVVDATMGSTSEAQDSENEDSDAVRSRRSRDFQLV